MRKIEQRIITAFIERRADSLGNTTTDGDTLYLHGNAIARWTRGPYGLRRDYGLRKDTLEITLAGWPTATTRSRLNALGSLLGHRFSVCQRNHEQYLARASSSFDQPMHADVWYRVSNAS